MGSVIRFSAVNTKIRALEGEMLSRGQIEKLIECRSYQESLLYIREETGYNSILKKYNLGEVHRGELEFILKRHYIESFSKLIHYFTGNYRKLLNIFFMRFEIEDLKVILRGKFIGKQKDEFFRLITNESPLSKIDYNSLIDSPSLEEAAEKLKGTPYYKHIAHLVKNVKAEGLFRLEMTLDFVYFLSLRKFVKHIEAEDRNIIQLFNGTYADLLNIQWIFRGKKYYKLNPDELINYTIYDGYKLNRDLLKSICYTQTLDEFYDAVSALPYGRIFEKSKYKEYLLEREILNYLKELYGKHKKSHKLNISVAIAYLELLLIECRDIISIVENKRYNQQNEEALRYITATL